MRFDAELLDPRRPLPAEWDRFVRAERLHRAWEAAPLGALATVVPRMWVALVHAGGTPVGVLCGGRVGTHMECRMFPNMPGTGFVLARDLGAGDRRAALAAFRRRMRRHHPLLVWRQVPPADLGPLRGLGRASLRATPTTWLPNQWATMGEYLKATFRQRHRKDLRRVRRRLEAELSVTVTAGDDGPAPAEAAALLAGHLDRWGVRPRVPRPPAAWFQALAGGEGMVRITYRDRDGTPVAGSVNFDDGEQLISGAWASSAPHRGLWGDHVLRLVGWTIERQLAGARFGKGLLDAKQRFGSELVPQFVVAGVL